MSQGKARLGIIAALLSWWTGVHGGDLGVGSMAPAFELRDQHGKVQRLGDYQGRWVVLYFYPKDDTPGCTTEACQFRDDIFTLTELQVAVLGVSMDDVESHQAFAEKYHLPFPLLSDADGRIAQAYGALFKLGPLKFAKRHSFIIDPDGRIAHIYRDVSPKTHSDEVIERVRALRGG